jgi:two-component system NtrC family response regulator
LSEITINVPPLRDRPADVLALSHAFLKRYSPRNGRAKRGFTEEALAALMAHRWPGNVRELENKVKVACLLSDDAYLSAADLTLSVPGENRLPLNLKEVRSRAEREAVTRAMSVTGGNISKAAELLGISRPTLYDLLARLGLPGHERSESTWGEAQ